jgi:hypothetical protein
MRGILAVLIGAVWIALRAFDLDDIGSEVREHHPGAGAGDESTLLEYAYAGQWSHHRLYPRWF